MGQAVASSLLQGLMCKKMLIPIGLLRHRRENIVSEGKVICMNVRDVFKIIALLFTLHYMCTEV